MGTVTATCGARVGPGAPSGGDSLAAVASVTHINDCAGEPRNRPGVLTLACGDGGYELAGLRWRSWGAPRVTATGVAVANLCEPTCVEGRRVRFRVTAVADGIVRGEASVRYTRLVVTAVGPRPTSVARREVYRLTGDGPVLVDGPAVPGGVFTAWGAGWRAVVSGRVLRLDGPPGDRRRVVRVRRDAFSRGVDFAGRAGGVDVNLHVTGGTCRWAGGAPSGYRAVLSLGSRTLRGCAVPRIIPLAG